MSCVFVSSFFGFFPHFFSQVVSSSPCLSPLQSPPFYRKAQPFFFLRYITIRPATFDCRVWGKLVSKRNVKTSEVFRWLQTSLHMFQVKASENMLETTNHPSLSNFLQMCLKIDRSRSRVTMFAKKRAGDWESTKANKIFLYWKQILGYNSTINSIKCTLPPTEPDLWKKNCPATAIVFSIEAFLPLLHVPRPNLERKTHHAFFLQQTLHQMCYLLI